MVRIEREDEMIFFIPDDAQLGLTMYTPGPRFAFLMERLLDTVSQDELADLFEEDD